MTRFDTPKTRGKLMFDVSMSKFNTWGVGGDAQCLFQPADLNDLCEFLANIDPDISVTWLGLGSNVLIHDSGIKGVVIVTQNGLKEIKFSNKTVYAQAGVACAKLARTSVSKGFTGIEFMAGIPGTIGGALAMNAGAFGGQTWARVDSVDIVNRQGEIISRNADEYEYGYRFVNTNDNEWFVGGRFKLESADKRHNVISIKELLSQRAATQPIGKKNCGSVFKNPENEYAANLIEKCGLKGFRIGGACVSNKHANFIINDDQASASDIESLIKHIQKTVQNQFNVNLIPEVRFIGEFIENKDVT